MYVIKKFEFFVIVSPFNWIWKNSSVNTTSNSDKDRNKGRTADDTENTE
jgi:hypothetical protein